MSTRITVTWQQHRGVANTRSVARHVRLMSAPLPVAHSLRCHVSHARTHTSLTYNGEIDLRVTRRTAEEVDATAVRSGVGALGRLDGEYGGGALRLEGAASVQRLHVRPVIAGGVTGVPGIETVCLCFICFVPVAHTTPSM